MNFEILKPTKDTIVFRPKEKKIDATNSSEFKAEFLILCRTGVKKMIIDLSHVEYCDSSGLSSLLFCNRRMRENNGTMILVGLRDKVLNLIKITSLDSLFLIYSTLEEALSTKT